MLITSAKVQKDNYSQPSAGLSMLVSCYHADAMAIEIRLNGETQQIPAPLSITTFFILLS